MNYQATLASPASILCVGIDWFPTTPSGLNRYLYELTCELAEQQDHVEICGVGLPDSSPISSIALTNLASPDSALLKRLWSARNRFQQRHLHSPNAINLHFALYSLPLLNHFPKNIPTTFTFHGPWALESQWERESKSSILFKRWIEQQVYDHCDQFIVLSQAFRELLHSTYRVPLDKIHIIPGGVDTTRFRADLSRQQARAKLNFPQDRPILFTPRRLVHRMGLETLLEAIVRIKHHVSDVWLAIAGTGPLSNVLKQQVQELGLEHHVRFLGYVPDEDLPIAYQAADLTVVPSQSLEGFGLILVESLACGTPVVCTPVGGMPEVVTPFFSDSITESVTAEAIAERTIDFITGNIPLPSRAVCQEYASNHFSWQKIATQVRQVLLNGKLNS